MFITFVVSNLTKRRLLGSSNRIWFCHSFEPAVSWKQFESVARVIRHAGHLKNLQIDTTPWYPLNIGTPAKALI